MIELPDRAAAADGEVRPPAATDRAPADLKADGRVDALMDALERDLRSGEIDEALLIELNWTPAQARAFVESYKRLKTGGQRQVAKTKLPGRPESANEARPPDNTVLRGKDSGSTGARGLHTTHSRSPDDTRELLEVGRQRVGPKYQSVLQAYYRSLATRPAGAAPMRGGSPSATPPG